MRGYDNRALRSNTLTAKDHEDILLYVRMQPFTDMIKKSPALSYMDKNRLWKRARSGDLKGAMKEYAELVSVRGDSKIYADQGDD